MKRIITILFCVAVLMAFLFGCQSPTSTSGIDTSMSSTEEKTSTTEEQPPVYKWEVDLPENHQMNAQLLNSLHIALEEIEIYSMVTVKDGYIVDEYYKEGYDENSIFRFNSCSKSFTSALIGIAIDEGLIDGVDVKISEYFPQLVGTEKENITIRHLLEHRSGLEWHEWTRNGESFFELNRADNWVDYVLSKPLVATPGTTFNYTTGGTHLLAAILEQVTEESLFDYAQKHIFIPLGMESVRWREDPQGILDGGNGIEMTGRDAAKFGQLFLNEGKWDGQQLIPQTWVETSTSAQVIREGYNGYYGYQWWVRPFADYDTYYAMGAMGQFIFVVPELNLVTVITANTEQIAPWPYFTDYVLQACSQS